MGRRLLRGSVKLGVLAAIIGGLVIISKKLMGGLGPEPGSDLAPKAWPSLIPEPDAGAAAGAAGAEGAASAAGAANKASDSTGNNGNTPAEAGADAATD